MVILKFNKLISNKWFWAAFAVLISIAFVAPDTLFSGRGDEESQDRDSVGTVGGEKVKLQTLDTLREDYRGFGQRRNNDMKIGELNRRAFESFAAMKTAQENGLEATDEDVRSAIRGDQSFAPNGTFDPSVYKAVLAQNGLTPERYESFLRRRITQTKVALAICGSAVWASPAEAERFVADFTDEVTVRVARFSQSKEEGDKVTLDDAALKSWYDDNTNSLALPECVRIRFVKYDTTDQVLAKMAVDETMVKDYYDANGDKYTEADTNGVERALELEKCRAKVEADLRRELALEFLRTNLLDRASAAAEKAGDGSVIEIVAKEDGLKVETSEVFALDGTYHEGFTRSVSAICPGVKDLAGYVREIDPETPSCRFQIVDSDKAVWLIEKAETIAARTPSFDESREIIRPRALRAAKAKAFKDSVEAIAKGGAKAVLATSDVSTNITFSAVSVDKIGNSVKNIRQIVPVACKLQPGEVSDFVEIGSTSGLLVVCESRKAGNADKVSEMKGVASAQVERMAAQAAMRDWPAWNLENQGFKPSESVTLTDEAEESL